MTAMIEADGLLPPAKEHVYDALAAFDRGQLQEAQNAFDLSVWADVKSDKGTPLICLSGPTSSPIKVDASMHVIRASCRYSSLVAKTELAPQSGLHNSASHQSVVIPKVMHEC